jgi:peptidylprolyl isomerase
MNKNMLARFLTSAMLLFISINSAQAYTNETHEEGLAFLKQNSTAEGVVTTDSGLQYKVLKKGSGTVHPSARDTVKVHYHGTLIDGTVFDSSVERGEPISFPLYRVIKGWTEGLQLMVVGEKTRLYIPSQLAYGFRSVGKIPAGSTLIFDVELLGINE